MVSGQTASLSLLRLSLGILNIGQSGSAWGSAGLGRGAFLSVAEEEEKGQSSPGGSVSAGGTVGGSEAGAGAEF